MALPVPRLRADSAVLARGAGALKLETRVHRYAHGEGDAEWANRQTPRNDALATVANDAREQVIQNTTARHLARELVQVYLRRFD
jgi:hypothetical protein